jgi:hypothetical protein
MLVVGQLPVSPVALLSRVLNAANAQHYCPDIPMPPAWLSLLDLIPSCSAFPNLQPHHFGHKHPQLLAGENAAAVRYSKSKPRC